MPTNRWTKEGCRRPKGKKIKKIKKTKDSDQDDAHEQMD
jgi:hypothetical protein